MGIVLADESLKKPAISFKWETRPGVSKFQQHDNHEPPPSSSSSVSLSLGSTSSNSIAPSKELQTQWVQSMSPSSSSKNSPSSSLTRIGLFSGHNGCFPISWSRWMKWRNERKLAKPKLKVKLELHPEHVVINKDSALRLEKLARWSMSSSWRASSSSFSSHIQRSSPDQSTFSNDNEAALIRLYCSLLGFLRRPKMVVGMERKKEISISVYVVNTKE